MKVLSIVLLTLLANIVFAQTKTWKPNADGNWNDAANWDPVGVPGVGDKVIFNGAANWNCTLNGAPLSPVASMEINGYTGNIDLNTFTLVINGSGQNDFKSGTFSGPGNLSITSTSGVLFQGTILGVNVNLSSTLTTETGEFNGSTGSTFNGTVTVTAHSILLNGSTYNSTATFTKSSLAAPTASTGSGGNTFNGATTIINAMNAALISANLNPDRFFGLLTLSLNGTTPACKINMAHAALNNEFHNDIRVRSENNSGLATAVATAEISFGAGDGSSTLASGFTITEVNNTYDPEGDAPDELLYGDLHLNNFTQLGNTPQSINLQIPETQDPSVLRMRLRIRSCVFNGPVTFSASNLFVGNSTFNGGPTNTFIKTRGGGSDVNVLYTPVPHATSSWDGGNTFNNATVIHNLGASTMGHSLIAGDVFNGNVTFRVGQTSSKFRIAYKGTTQFKGNIILQELAAGIPSVEFGDVIQGGIAEFNGSGAQALSFNVGQAFTPNFYNLRMNNSSGLTLNLPITITTNLDLASGVINLTGTNYLSVLSNATVTGAMDGRYVDGPVRKTGTTAFTFPIGDNGSFHPLGISVPTNGSEFSAQYFMTDHGNGAEMDAPLVKVSDCEYWVLNRLSGADDVTATLYWNNDASFCHPNYIQDPHEQQLRVASWSGATYWNSLGGVLIDDTASPDGTEGNVTSAVIVPAFPRTLTFASESAFNSLPVALLSFRVTPGTHGADLTWQTASEHNNDYFTIERFHPEQFVSLVKIPGAGTTTQPSDYQWTDPKPSAGLSYYRLKQTDFDGRETYSEVVSFTHTSEHSPYPNPVKNILHLEGLSFDEDSNIVIKDISGRTLYTGRAAMTVDFGDFASGVYHLAVRTKGTLRWYSIKKD